MLAFRRVSGRLLSYVLPRPILNAVFIYLFIAPRVRRSQEYKEQVRLVNVMFPGEKVMSRVIWSRDWGSSASLALTRVLAVQCDTVAGFHPEVEACLQGEEGAQEYVRKLVEVEGWSPQAARERVQKTMRLLRANSDNFVSEATLLENDGTPGIILHDGNHRAAIRLAQGHPTVRIRVTMNLHLT